MQKTDMVVCAEPGRAMQETRLEEGRASSPARAERA